jgi:hypothetical protein
VDYKEISSFFLKGKWNHRDTENFKKQDFNFNHNDTFFHPLYKTLGELD